MVNESGLINRGEPQLRLGSRPPGGGIEQACLVSLQTELQGQTRKQVQVSLGFCQVGATKEQWDRGCWRENRGAWGRGIS